MRKQNPFIFSLSFLNTYNASIFRKGRRKNSLSCTYLWQGLIFRFLSFTGEWHPQNLAECTFLLSFVQRFCSLLFTDDFHRAWLNWRLSLANVCPELKILLAGEGTSRSLVISQHIFPRRLLSSNWRFFSKFPLTKRYHFGAKGSIANHLTFSFSHHSIRLWYSSELDFFLCPTDYRSWSAGSFDLHYDLDSLLCSTGCRSWSARNWPSFSDRFSGQS